MAPSRFDTPETEGARAAARHTASLGCPRAGGDNANGTSRCLKTSLADTSGDCTGDDDAKRRLLAVIGVPTYLTITITGEDRRMVSPTLTTAYTLNV